MNGYFLVKRMFRENVGLYVMLSLAILRFDLIIEYVLIKKRGSWSQRLYYFFSNHLYAGERVSFMFIVLFKLKSIYPHG